MKDPAEVTNEVLDELVMEDIKDGNKEVLEGISPQSCTETDFEMKTSNFVFFLLISVVSVHFRAIYDEIIHCQA